MRSTKVWLCLLLLINTQSCSSSTGSDPCGSGFEQHDVYTGHYMFEECTSLSITANNSAFDLLEPVRVTISCFPVFEGTGLLRVQFLPQDQSSSYKGILIDTPAVEQTLEYTYEEKVRLKAGVPFQASWSIRVQDRTKHFLSGSVGFDSVCIDTIGCLAISSDDARQLFGLLDPRPAANYPAYELAKPRN